MQSNDPVIQAHIDRIVSQAPPLSDEQRDRLAAILRTAR